MLTTLLDVVALLLIVGGIALVSIPAALVVAGLGLGAVSYLMAGRR